MLLDARPCVLLRDLIDYAGLFPPASLAMASSVANYDAYSQSEWNWILGRFIVPVARLGEFEEALAGLPTPADEASSPIGDCLAFWAPMLLRMSLAFANSMLEWRARSSGSGAVVESVEVKVASPEEVIELQRIIPAELATYFEVPAVEWRASASRRSPSADAGPRSARAARHADKFPILRERDRIHSPVCGGQCAFQGDCGTAPSAALGAPVYLSTRQPVGNHARLSECFSGRGVFAGGHGTVSLPFSCSRSNRQRHSTSIRMESPGASIGSAARKSPPHARTSQFRLARAHSPSPSTTYGSSAYLL